MAHRIGSFADAPTKSRDLKYPWADWTDGTIWTARRGEDTLADFDCACGSFIAGLRGKARDIGMRVKLQSGTTEWPAVDDEGKPFLNGDGEQIVLTCDVITFQFVPKVQAR